MPGATTSTSTRTPTVSFTRSTSSAGQARGGVAGREGVERLDPHGEDVEPARAGEDAEVVRRQAVDAEDLLLDLAREDVDAADDHHVVAPPGHTLHPAMRSERGAGEETREVARAVADDRHRLLRERREDELAHARRPEAPRRSPGRRSPGRSGPPRCGGRPSSPPTPARRRGRSPRRARRGRRRASGSASRSRRASRSSRARRRRSRSRATTPPGRAPTRSISSTIERKYDGVTMITRGSKSAISCTWRSVMPPETGTTVQPSRSAP